MCIVDRFEADTPRGPYREHSKGRVTPEDWNSLDGTLHVDRQGRPWMVFCHEWTQIGNGTVEAVRLKKDLSGPAGKPVTLFKASEAPWVRSHVPGEKLYVTDGPFLLRNSRGELLMLWSSFTDEGYATGLARSRSGDIGGPWEQFPQPIFRRDGGHGMILRTFDGRLLLSIHQPNRTPDELSLIHIWLPHRPAHGGQVPRNARHSGRSAPQAAIAVAVRAASHAGEQHAEADRGSAPYRLGPALGNSPWPRTARSALLFRHTQFCNTRSRFTESRSGQSRDSRSVSYTHLLSMSRAVPQLRILTAGSNTESPASSTRYENGIRSVS